MFPTPLAARYVAAGHPRPPQPNIVIVDSFRIF